jgi:hypothetical protein
MTMLTMLTCAVLSAGPKAPPAAGQWEGDGFVLHLAPDGSGTLADSPMSSPEAIRWKATANSNSLVIIQDGEAVTYGMRLSGDVMALSGGDLDAPVRLRRAGASAAGAPRRQVEPSRPAAAQAPVQPPTCPGACTHFLRCAQKLGAANVGPQAQATCLAACQQSAMSQAELAVFNQLTCEQAVLVVLAAAQQEQGQSAAGQQRGSGACRGCVRWGDDCMWASQSDWGPGHSGNSYSGAVSSCDPSCCGM